MSLRPAVSRERVEVFLRQLADHYRRPARLYLVGGTTLVFEGYRQQTLDVDVAIEVSGEAHGELMAALRKIKDALNINIEEVSPGDFIPLPGGYADRHIFIGRYGQVDVFHFDLYSASLSKIERGRQQDLEDVVALLQHDRLEWSRLESMFREILPLMEQKSLKHDSQEFALNFEALRALWHSAGGTL